MYKPFTDARKTHLWNQETSAGLKLYEDSSTSSFTLWGSVCAVSEQHAHSGQHVSCVWSLSTCGNVLSSQDWGFPWHVNTNVAFFFSFCHCTVNLSQQNSELIFYSWVWFISRNHNVFVLFCEADYRTLLVVSLLDRQPADASETYLLIFHYSSKSVASHLTFQRDEWNQIMFNLSIYLFRGYACLLCILTPVQILN